MSNIHHDPSGCIRSENMCYVVSIATNVKTYEDHDMGHRAIIGSGTGSSRIRSSEKDLFTYIGIAWHNTTYIQTVFRVASLHYRSGTN
eukprot:6183786-Pleurochrysis_carterae.AAC.2